jgi:hypothetical protein
MHDREREQEVQGTAVCETFTWEKGDRKECNYIQGSQFSPARPSGGGGRGGGGGGGGCGGSSSSSSSNSSSSKMKEYVRMVAVLA